MIQGPWERRDAQAPAFRVHRECTAKEFLLLLMIDDAAPLDQRRRAAEFLARRWPNESWIDSNPAEDFGLRSVDYVPIRPPQTAAEKALWEQGFAPRRG